MSARDDAPWTLRRVLAWTTGFFEEKGLDQPRLDAELLIGHAQGLSRLQLYLQLDKPLDAEELARIRGSVRRRAAGEPVAYITGRRGFWTLELQVDARVLIPRPETEDLVARALGRLRDLPAPRVVDVGTGSGCVALALAEARPDARITAVDVSAEALAVAQLNRDALGLSQVELRQGDLLEGLAGPLDLVVSNPPYITDAALATLPLDVRGFEPRLALAGGPDGLELIRRLIDQAATRLRPGGGLLIEIGFDQGEALRALLGGDRRFTAVEVHPDLAGHPRVAEATAAG